MAQLATRIESSAVTSGGQTCKRREGEKLMVQALRVPRCLISQCTTHTSHGRVPMQQSPPRIPKNRLALDAQARATPGHGFCKASCVRCAPRADAPRADANGCRSRNSRWRETHTRLA